MNLTGRPAGVCCTIEALGESDWWRFADAGKLLVRTIQVKNELGVRLDVRAAGLGDEARHALHAPGLGTGQRWNGTGWA